MPLSKLYVMMETNVENNSRKLRGKSGWFRKSRNQVNDSLALFCCEIEFYCIHKHLPHICKAYRCSGTGVNTTCTVHSKLVNTSRYVKRATQYFHVVMAINVEYEPIIMIKFYSTWEAEWQPLPLLQVVVRYLVSAGFGTGDVTHKFVVNRWFVIGSSI